MFLLLLFVFLLAEGEAYNDKIYIYVQTAPQYLFFTNTTDANSTMEIASFYTAMEQAMIHRREMLHDIQYTANLPIRTDKEAARAWYYSLAVSSGWNDIVESTFQGSIIDNTSWTFPTQLLPNININNSLSYMARQETPFIGGTFALGVSTLLSHVVDIATSGKTVPHLSAMDVLSCCQNCHYMKTTNGTKRSYGGSVYKTLRYAYYSGVSTGATFTDRFADIDSQQTDFGCRPYNRIYFDMNIMDTQFNTCDTCENDEFVFDSRRYIGKPVVYDNVNGRQLKRIIQIKGPVLSTIAVYWSYLLDTNQTYWYVETKWSQGPTQFTDSNGQNSTGYLYATDLPIGYTTVEIVGWDAEGWLCLNFWGSKFGFASNGLIRIPFNMAQDQFDKLGLYKRIFTLEVDSKKFQQYPLPPSAKKATLF